MAEQCRATCLQPCGLLGQTGGRDATLGMRCSTAAIAPAWGGPAPAPLVPATCAAALHALTAPALCTTRRYDSVADLGSPEEAADRLKQQVRGQTKSRQCLCPPVAWRWLLLLQACSCSAAAGTYGHLAAVRAGEVQRPFLLCMRHCAPAPHQRLQFQRACSPDPPHVLCSPWRSLPALFQF